MFAFLCVHREGKELLGLPGSHQEKAAQHKTGITAVYQTGVIVVYSILADGPRAKLADVPVLSGLGKQQIITWLEGATSERTS